MAGCAGLGNDAQMQLVFVRGQVACEQGHHVLRPTPAKMRDQQQKHGYDTSVKAWLEKPEQAELVTSLKATISPHMKPEQQSKALVNQAKNYIRNTGMKIG